MTAPPPAGIQDAARHLAEDRTEEAVAVLERLVGTFPMYVTAHVLLAKAYEADGRLADALGSWHHAYFLMPGSPLVLRERARLLRAELSPPAAATAPAPGAAGAGPLPAAEAPAAPSAEAPEPTGSLIDEVDDLDGLIERLGSAPRIRPDADFDDDGVGWAEADDDEDIVSETLARIYESQGEHEAAARAYERLAALHPERAADLRTKAAALRRLTEGSKR